MMNLNNVIVSIDGPAGSGKQRIAKYIAKKYQFFHLDSGVLYRRLSLNIINKNINYKNQLILKKYISSLKSLSVRNHKNLRKENISKISSQVAKSLIVRNFINKQQRKIINKKLKVFSGCVIDGRDIGSKVFKNAKIKLFINVKSEIRAKRRHKQLIGMGEKSIYSRILKEINLRDKQDITRKQSPLIIPKGAIIIDNSNDFLVTLKNLRKILPKLIK